MNVKLTSQYSQAELEQSELSQKRGITYQRIKLKDVILELKHHCINCDSNWEALKFHFSWRIRSYTSIKVGIIYLRDQVKD